MTLNDIALEAVEQIKHVGDFDYTAEQEKKIRAAVEEAILGATKTCCIENTSIVDEHLSRNVEAARLINAEVENRRKLLISNLSAMR